MRQFVFAWAVLLFVVPCRADTFAQWGIAVEHPGAESYSDVKFAEIGKCGDYGRLSWMAGFGGWVDKTDYKKDGFETSNGYFLEALFGVEPKSEHIYVNYRLGPAIISNTDALLGSNIQISQEFGAGFMDIRNLRVGLIIKHYSNAGLVRPNGGRNFIGFRIQFQ